MPLSGLSQSFSGQGDSNTEMLSVLFNSSFEQSLYPMELPGNAPGLPLNHSVPEIFPSAVPFSPNSSISNRGGVDGITSRIQKVWPASPQQSDSNIRPYFWQEIAFGSLENIFSSCDLAVGVLDPALEDRKGINEWEISLSDNSKARLRNLKRKLMVCGCSDFLDGSNVVANIFVSIPWKFLSKGFIFTSAGISLHTPSFTLSLSTPKKSPNYCYSSCA